MGTRHVVGPMAERPTVTAVVVVFRYDDESTEQCIASLASSLGATVEVCVVHNGDVGDWPAVDELCRRYGATALRSPLNHGYGAALNLALVKVPADQAVFLLNDDAWVMPDTISACLDVLAEAGERCISVAPMVVHADAPERVDSLGVVLRPSGDAFNAYQGRQRSDIAALAVDVLGPCFAAALFRPGAFAADKVGLLSERYFLYCEDVEWNVRARHHGFHSVAAPHAIAFHHHALSTRELGEPTRIGLVQRNLLVMTLATLSPWGVFKVWTRQAVIHTKALIRDPHRRPRLRALAGAVALVPWAVAVRRRNRGQHPVADHDLFRFSDGHAPAIDPATYTLS